MRRLLEQALIVWKKQEDRKPVLLDGARQVGKSYLIERLFGPSQFARVHRLDLRETPALHELFEESLDPDVLLANIELYLGSDINPQSDLLFFDEIGECQRAVDSLKYFAEKRPDIYLCASGSNIGLLESFPVGKVQILELFPLSFEEFLMASGDERLLEKYREMSRLKMVHEKLWEQLLDYYYVGGMPEAVAGWFTNKSLSINERAASISRIHADLIKGYERDFGKYGDKVNAIDIDRVFRNIPLQLSSNRDDSVKRFHFRDVLGRKNRYQQLKGPIDWLEKSGLASKCYPVGSRPATPLKSLIRDNIFKLFFFDIGLLGHLLELSYKEQKDQKTRIKGFIAENFVQNELRAAGIAPTYSWAEGQAEIEFLLKTREGAVVPVEVKSGRRTRAKSLAVYKQKYQPEFTVKLVGAAGGTNARDLVWPLYYAAFLARL